MEMQPDKAWAPNANSTIRLTYGKVGSYKPRDAVFYDYYTTLTGVIEKEGPKGGEFEVPDRLKELYAQQDFAPYGTDKLSVNFITDNDITGGNSGSGVINAEGHLIGMPSTVTPKPCPETSILKKICNGVSISTLVISSGL